MNRIVRENYPVSKLPEDIRQEFPGLDEVTLIIDGRPPTESQLSIDDQAALAEIKETGIRGGDFSRFKRFRRSNFKSSEEVNAYLSALRDEWTHRER